MTKEEIRKGIKELIDNNYGARNPSYPKLIAFQPVKFLNELLPYLHSKGVAIVKSPPKDLTGCVIVLVESLIEEKK